VSEPARSAELVADLRNAVEVVLDHMERLDDGAYYRIPESAAVSLTEAWEALNDGQVS
jgi:hypothetical protein